MFRWCRWALYCTSRAAWALCCWRYCRQPKWSIWRWSTLVVCRPVSCTPVALASNTLRSAMSSFWLYSVRFRCYSHSWPKLAVSNGPPSTLPFRWHWTPKLYCIAIIHATRKTTKRPALSHWPLSSDKLHRIFSTLCYYSHRTLYSLFSVLNIHYGSYCH